MKRKIRLWLSLFLLAILMSGCQKSDSKLLEEEQTPDSDTVNLTVWGAGEAEGLLSQFIDGFQSEYSGQKKNRVRLVLY